MGIGREERRGYNRSTGTSGDQNWNFGPLASSLWPQPPALEKIDTKWFNSLERTISLTKSSDRQFPNFPTPTTLELPDTTPEVPAYACVQMGWATAHVPLFATSFYS
jgi:hypothetical protein